PRLATKRSLIRPRAWGPKLRAHTAVTAGDTASRTPSIRKALKYGLSSLWSPVRTEAMRRPPRPRPTKPSAVSAPSLLTDQRAPLVRRLCEAEKHFDALLG